MRFVSLLTGGALALAVPALGQTNTTAPAQTVPAPQATPTPAITATPVAPADAATPADTGAPATTATPVPIPPTVGATVYGSAGTPVGTIKAMDPQFITLTTTRGEVRLPAAGVGPGLKGPVIGLTAEQLDSAIAQAQATSQAAATKATTKATKKR
ncbi:hypothetical protein [Sphingomonas sp.]|uniref:hypothetical protein n=1 Tax=Sphingomonas sp. TaxID=28214 RepID=UPI002D8058FE|nr:hypothetical protein [Sphingomonas sp.]HEU0044782.1 hypothetical protein [Sphingomonas sp.]